MKRICSRIAFLMFGALLTTANALDLYVSTSGSDTNEGNAVKPFATLAAAQKKARQYAGKEAVTVHIADGIYYLPETLVLTPADSGTVKKPVTYKAVNEGGAVLSGGSLLDLDWEFYREGIYKAKTPAGLGIDQVFINGRNQRMARYPNYDAAKQAVPYQGYSADAFSNERAAGWADPAGGYIHAMHRSGWGGYHYTITGKSADGTLTYEGGWQNNRQMGMHKHHRMVENIFEELDAEGEWYHDADTQTLYYKPMEGIDLERASVEVVRLRHLVEFQGSEANPVRHITLLGFVVRHAARTFMDTKEPLLRSDWTIYRGGAYFLTGTENIQILDTEFDQVGGNAVFVSHYNRGVLIRGCYIHDSGASGVCFVGDPAAVRNPLFEYHEKNDLSQLDLIPGPITNNYPADSVVEDCLMHGIGQVERQPAGVQISMARRITIRDTSIYDTARAGINISEGTWGGHLIERCDVFDTVLETHDHGSFNSWGRDRFWRSDHKETSGPAVDLNPELPYLDAMETTVIRDSRWRCEHGWDVDLDDGSSNYEIYNNLMLCGGLKLREGYRRKAWNNVIVNNGLSSHVWFANSEDMVTGNIMARAASPLLKVKVPVDGLVDKNFYYREKASRLERLAKTVGWDANSIVGDPMFVNPEKGDFRVKAGSPAFEVGFKNFPMDQFGVKKPSLKAIAKEPSFGPKPPKTQKVPAAKKKTSTNPQHWHGAELSDLSGMDFSAYGVSREEAGVALRAIKPGSVAEKAGLTRADLIQGVNGIRIANIVEFLDAVERVRTRELKLRVIRNQQVMEVVLMHDAGVEQSDGRPNIVFLMTDDQRWDTLGCYGREDVLTPNIDRLAKQGVIFDNAYYAVAICMPSRVTMFTGRYFSDHQVGFTYPYNRTLPKVEFADSYPAQLKAAGYRTGFVGKFGIRLAEQAKTVGQHFDYFVKGNHVFFPKDDPELKAIYRKDRPANERTLKKGDAMIRFLDTQPADQPFCLSISFDAVKNDKDRDMFTPHFNLFKDKQMWVPENWVAGKNTRLPKVLDYCRGTWLHAERTSTPELYQTLARRFAAQGYTVDQQVGRLIEKLNEMGVLENTVIIYTSDNGRFQGSQGLYDKALLYEESIKAPMIVFDGRADAKRRGVREAAMISSVDVAPTIMDLAGVEPPSRVRGQSLKALLAGEQNMSEWRQTVLMENFFLQELWAERLKKSHDFPSVNDSIIANNRSYRTRGVRTERYKYFKYFEHNPVVEELYDLEQDPYEQNNVVANPEYAGVLAELRNETERLLQAATK